MRVWISLVLLPHGSAARRVDSAAAGGESEFREVSRKTTVPPEQRKRNIQGIIANNRRLVLVGPDRRVRLLTFSLRLQWLPPRQAGDKHDSRAGDAGDGIAVACYGVSRMCHRTFA